MPEIKVSPFRTTRMIQRQIDQFLDKVSEAGLLLEEGVHHYLRQGCDETVLDRYERVHTLEHDGDQLRHDIETTLYTEMLIPESRGDVLSLLDDLDGLLDGVKKRYHTLTIEQPEVPEELVEDAIALASIVTRCIETTVSASRAYFRDPGSVRDYIHKIGFYESEADEVVTRLHKSIFASSLSMGRKILLRDGLLAIDDLADLAEDTGDRLAIYAVKRSI
jgi:predicted phosphate transport protein (TIGR00153 family)